MNKLLGFAAAAGTGLAAVLSTTPASALSMEVIACEGATCVNSGLIPGGSIIFGPTPVGDFSVSATGFAHQPPLAGQAIMETQTIDITTDKSGVTLSVAIIAFDLNTPSNAPGGATGFTSSFVANTLINATATGQTFIDPTSGGANILSLAGPVAFTTVLNSILGSADTGGPDYSMTAFYTITSTAAQSAANLTINVQVPGPIVGAGLPGLIAGLAGLIALARRRRNRALA